MTDTNLRWIPRFDFGSTSVEFTYPVTPWNPGSRTEGSLRRSGTGAAGAVIRYRKYLLTFTLRFLEDEWVNVIALMNHAQVGASFTWYPRGRDVSTPETVECFLESPRITEEVRPTRDPSLPWLMTLPITISRTDEPWSLEFFNMFEFGEGGGEPVPPTDGVAYVVTADDYFLDPSTTTPISAQLVDIDENPVAESGHVVTWSKTGTGGTFSAPTSITNISGIATVDFTVSATLDTEHTVTATDELANTGTSDVITAASDGLGPLRAIGNCELLIDSIAGVTGNGTFVTAIVDHSGNNRVTTLPADANKPRFTATKWNGTHPAMQSIAVNLHRWEATLPAIPQPFSVVTVLDGYTQGSGTGGNMNVWSASGAVAFRGSGTLQWSLFFGTVVSTGIVTSASLGKVMRTDIVNGAASRSYRGTTDGGAINPGAGAIGAGTFRGFSSNAGDGTTAIMAACVVYSKVLTSTQIATILAFFQARYPNLTGT